MLKNEINKTKIKKDKRISKDITKVIFFNLKFKNSLNVYSRIHLILIKIKNQIIYIKENL